MWRLASMSSISGRAGFALTGDEPAAPLAAGDEPAAALGAADDAMAAFWARASDMSDGGAAESPTVEEASADLFPLSAAFTGAGTSGTAGSRERAEAHPCTHIRIVAATLFRIVVSL